MQRPAARVDSPKPYTLSLWFTAPFLDFGARQTWGLPFFTQRQPGLVIIAPDLPVLKGEWGSEYRYHYRGI